MSTVFNLDIFTASKKLTNSKYRVIVENRKEVIGMVFFKSR